MGYIISVAVYTKYQAAQIRWKRIHTDITGMKYYDPKCVFQMEYEDEASYPGFCEFWNFRDIFDSK